jgi:MYXO-CTERM domain-containing protein
MLRLTLPTVLVLLTAALAATPAWPCSPALPSLWGTTAPTDSDEGVPLNARLVIGQNLPAMAATATLDDGSGAPRAVGMTNTNGLVVVTLDELAPDTDYTLSFEVPDDGISEGRDPVRFRTSDAADEQAPSITTPAGAAEVDFHAATPTMVDSCGGGSTDRWTVKIPLPEASDDQGIAGYRLLLVDDLGGREERSVRLQRDAENGDEFLFDFHHKDGELTYVVEVFDLAGNSVAGEPFTVGLFYGGGCSATDTPRTGAPLFALALLAGLVGVVRRRGRVS